MELLAKKVNGSRTIAVFSKNLCFRCLAGFWLCLQHLWRSYLNRFVAISFLQLLLKVSDGTINSNCCLWLVTFPDIFIVDFQQVVVLRIEIRDYNQYHVTTLKKTTHRSLKFINHYAIRQLTVKRNGFMMLENPLVALATTFNCCCSIYLLVCFSAFFSLNILGIFFWYNCW